MRTFAIREERQGIGLGLEFLKEARAVVDAIGTRGEYVTAPYKRYTTFVVRREFLDRFPYRIFFIETDEVREVIAVLRDGQDEARWKATI